MLTYDDVMTLTGRELDAAVAEHVLGLPVVWSSTPPYATSLEFRSEGRLPYLKGFANGCEYDWALVPRYSADIAAAWEVAEKTRLFLIPGQTGDNEWKWVCAPVSKAPGWGSVSLFRERHWVDLWYESEHVVDESAPLAICRAALLAVAKEGLTNEQAAD